MLRESGHEVSFLDGIHADEDEFVRLVHREGIELIGLLMMGWGWSQAGGFLRRLKEEAPDTRIAVGGPWPDVMQRQCLEESEAVDFAGAGDGENVMRDLVACLEARGDLANVRGIAWREPPARCSKSTASRSPPGSNAGRKKLNSRSWRCR